jgi:hypothetical protein
MSFLYKIFLICLILTGLGLTRSVEAQTANGGLNAFDFLQITPYARAIGVGGAYTALGDDVGSIYYNPAGIASVLTTEVNMAYVLLYQGLSYESLSFAYPMDPVLHGLGGTFAISVNLLQPGTLEQTNNNGVTIGTFAAGDDIFTLSYAHNLGSDFQAGFTIKDLQQQIATISSSLFAVDLGVLFAPGNNGFRVGVDIKNIGSSDSGFNLPLALNTGVSFRKYNLFSRQDDFALAVDTSIPLEIQDSLAVNIGGEYNLKWVGNRLTLRGGYNFIGTTDLTGVGLAIGAGYGFDFSGLVLFVDYAYTPEDVFGDANHISLTTKF